MKPLPKDILRVTGSILGGLMAVLLAYACCAASPRIDGLRVRTEANGCVFADFTITGGDAGNYWLQWRSPQFIGGDLWLAVAKVTNNGSVTVYQNVPLYTNDPPFNCAFLRLEWIKE